MKNRSRNEIIASILQVINRGGSTKTKIMYGAFLPYSQLNEYLSFLLKMDLIVLRTSKRTSSSPSFTITEKGMHFVNINNQINEMMATTVQST